MPLKMTMMFKKYIITLQISNSKLKKSVIVADFFNEYICYKTYIWPDYTAEKSKYLLAQFWLCLASH